MKIIDSNEEVMILKVNKFPRRSMNQVQSHDQANDQRLTNECHIISLRYGTTRIHNHYSFANLPAPMRFLKLDASKAAPVLAFHPQRPPS
jgi:hypothetical protein